MTEATARDYCGEALVSAASSLRAGRRASIAAPLRGTDGKFFNDFSRACNVLSVAFFVHTSDAHAMREPAIDGGCSELATDNRLVGSSSPPSPPRSPMQTEISRCRPNSTELAGFSCGWCFVSAFDRRRQTLRRASKGKHEGNDHNLVASRERL